jgi:hypothetical protein
MEFEPIVLRYEGLEAADHRIDLSQVGQSLQGAAQLLGTAASIVATGEYARRPASMPVKILAGEPRGRCWEIPAIIVSTGASIAQIDLFAQIGRKLASEATAKIVNYVVARFETRSIKVTDTARALETVEKAMTELGQTSRHAMDSVVRMAEMQRPAVRSLVVPIGLSVSTLQVGDSSQGGILIDRELREAIDAPVEAIVETARNHEILISEMDRLNQTCKFAFRDDQNPERRLSAQITDPIIQTPNDPYSAAFSAQRWIIVVGKLQRKGGEADRLFISDIIG